jgi:TRAP transporter TAXI family solute receptor
MTSRRLVLSTAVAAGALALAACGGGGATSTAEGDQPLKQAVIATYGTGTSTYADMAAVANGLTETDGLKTRIITSDTAIGRMLPLKQGQAQFARTGDEYIFAFRGEHDFATKEWGPQEVRVVWAPVAPHGWMTKADSGIETAADLAGKKVPQITANPSVNQKTEAMLATAGLTWNDVTPVEIGYGEQPDALKAGKLDVLFQQVYGASLYELESSTPVRWIDFDADDAQTQAAVAEGAPSVRLDDFTGAPGQEEGQPDVGWWYSVPVVTYADTSETVAYQLAKGIVDAYDSYKDATATTSTWSIDDALVAPTEVPFHPGLVKLLEEEGKWTAEAQARQDELLAQEETLAEGWKEVSDSADLAAEWDAWKAQNLS